MIDPGMEERSPEGWMLHDLKKMMKDLRKYQAEIKETLATADRFRPYMTKWSKHAPA